MNYISFHHSDVGNTGEKQLQTVNEYHRQKWNMLSSLGWYGGYNYFCDVDGSVTQFRKEGEETVAQAGHNLDTISMCLAGDFNVGYPTLPQRRALKKFIGDHAGLEFKFHRELQANRTCPGNLMNHVWINENVLNISEDSAGANAGEITMLQTKLSMLQKVFELYKKLAGK